MSQKLWQKAIDDLADTGLNLFCSTKIDNLPEEILKKLSSENIVYQDYTSIICIGHGGSKLWGFLPEDKCSHPLDTFTTQKINEFMISLLGNQNHLLLYPHNDKIIPLQKIGRFFNLSQQSAMGIDINGTYGLWFAFRGVFLVKESTPEIFYTPFESPCDHCKERPCIKGSDFWTSRALCPYQAEHIYSKDQREYHQGLEFSQVK